MPSSFYEIAPKPSPITGLFNLMKAGAVSLRLARGREKPVLNRHPWIFSGAIAKIKGRDPLPGDIVEILDADDGWIARAYYNPHSQIRARILTWDAEEAIDDAFWRRKLELAARRRSMLKLEPKTTAYRLVNAEADGLPGLIVDKYGDHLVVQCLTFGIDSRKEVLARLLVDLFNPAGIVERSDAKVRKKEGLHKVVALLYGKEPPTELVVQENSLTFSTDLYRGHKTGLYLDQRENRAAVCHPTLAAGREILNVFAYTGGFAVYAAASGAGSITNVEESARFLEVIGRNMQLNDLDRPDDRNIAGDAFRVLRQLRDEGQMFDMVILDPPKFAHSKRDVPAACRGYKDMNLLALQLLRPMGLLATFSCSGLVSQELFQKVVFGAAVDAGRDVQIIKHLDQSADHPVLLTFPESAYLKGFLCQVG